MDTPHEQPDPAAEAGSSHSGHSTSEPAGAQQGSSVPPPSGRSGSSPFSSPSAQGGPFPTRSALPAGPRFFGWIRQLGVVRGRNRWIGGVASGLAERWRIDPVIVRGLVVVLTLFFGIGLLAYGLAWALLPEPNGRIHAEEVGRGRWSTGMTGASAFTLLGLVGPGRGLVFGDHDGWWFPWPLLWIAAAIALVLWATNRGSGQGRAARQQPSGGQYPYRPGAEPWASYPQTAYAPAGPGGPAGPAGTGSYATGTAESAGTGGAAGAGAPGQWAPGASGWAGNTNPTQPVGPVGAPPSFEPFDRQQHGAPYPSGSIHPGTGYPGAQRLRPPRPPRPGASTVAIGTGLAILAGALVLLLSSSRVLFLGAYTGATAWAAAGIVLGLVILVAGLRGRTSGALGFFAVVALLVAGAFSLAPQANAWSLARNSSWTPTGVADAGQGFSIAAGKGTVDLRQFAGGGPLAQDVEVPVSLAAADVTVLLPNDIPVTVQSQLAFAQVDNDGTNSSNPPIGTSSYTLNDGAQGHSIVLRIHAAAGHVYLQVAESGAQQ
jgi:phage shock protein PspC (stress-responsive transcriptional regulator)